MRRADRAHRLHGVAAVEPDGEGRPDPDRDRPQEAGAHQPEEVLRRAQPVVRPPRQRRGHHDRLGGVGEPEEQGDTDLASAGEVREGGGDEHAARRTDAPAGVAEDEQGTGESRGRPPGGDRPAVGAEVDRADPGRVHQREQREGAQVLTVDPDGIHEHQCRSDGSITARNRAIGHGSGGPVGSPESRGIPGPGTTLLRALVPRCRHGCPQVEHGPLVSERIGQFFHDGHRLEYTEYGGGDRWVVLLHGQLMPRRMHQHLARAPGRLGRPRGDPGPARPRALGPARRPAGLLDDRLRRAGGRAARRPRHRAGRHRGYVARGQRLARGGRPRARAGARPDRGDAGARQRAGGGHPRLRAAAVRLALPARWRSARCGW